jgi:hypothetical protein
LPKCLHISLIRPSSGRSALSFKRSLVRCFKTKGPEVRLSCLLRAARAPDARRPLPSASAYHLTRYGARLTAAGIPTRRHGDVHIIYKLSVALAATSSCNEHDQHDLAAGVCRCVRARVHWLARCLPMRACRAFALLRLTAAFSACLCLAPQVEFAVADSAASVVVSAAPT